MTSYSYAARPRMETGRDYVGAELLRAERLAHPSGGISHGQWECVRSVGKPRTGQIPPPYVWKTSPDAAITLALEGAGGDITNEQARSREMWLRALLVDADTITDDAHLEIPE